tara:strand:+ start:8050 stop:8256 length:207 start_codon:yes stop_codon:yes gene_type:complete
VKLLDPLMKIFKADGKYKDPCFVCKKKMEVNEKLKDVFLIRFDQRKTKELIRIHSGCMVSDFRMIKGI